MLLKKPALSSVFAVNNKHDGNNRRWRKKRKKQLKNAWNFYQCASAAERIGHWAYDRDVSALKPADSDK